jgi:hypothetical protein
MTRVATIEMPSAATSEMLARLRRTRRLLILGATIRALAFGLAAALAIVAAAVFADSIRAIPRALREAVLPAALIAAVVATSGMLWHHRFATSMRRVARWVEEREPRLEFALLTALDAGTPQAARSQMESAVRHVPWEPLVSRRLRTALWPPLAAVGILGVLLLIAPSASRARVTAPAPGDALDAPGVRNGDAVDPLSPLVVIVTPPAYTGRSAVTLEDPSSIEGLAGSTVILRGRATSTGVTASLDDAALDVATSGGRWSATFRMPQRPEAVRLKHRTTERIVILEPRIDSVPVAALERPAADTVFATPSGAIDVAATLHDDIGIASGGLEYIVSSGSGETFSFRSGTLSPAAGGGRSRITLATRLVVDSLKLAAGDVVHLRAFARDANTVNGPSIGYSETRALRIVRADERDSVAVDAAPPPEADASLVSQRMLIILTEALQARRDRMTRPNVVAESRRLAADQKKLRRSVGDIIFTRLGTEPDAEHVHGPGDAHDAGDMTPAELLRAAERANIAGREEALDFQRDESPIVAINRPLLEAYNHMWDASRELDIGEPGRALPPMRAALAAIQRARQAERIYLRGRAAPVIVDVAAVRLQGKESGDGSERSPRFPLERREEMLRFTRAIDLLASAPQQGIDSLLLLRVDLLADRPSAAQPLGESIDLLRSGRDATAALGRARRALLGEPVAVPGLGRWGSPW